MQGGEGACTQIANVWERADFHRREVRLNCSKRGPEVANTLGLKNATRSVQKNIRRGDLLEILSLSETPVTQNQERLQFMFDG